jgi:hypothetical protein
MAEWERVEGGYYCNYMMPARKVLWDWRIPEDTRIRCRFSARWTSEGTPRDPALRCELHHQADVHNEEMIMAMLEWLQKSEYIVMPYIPLLEPIAP